MGQTQIIYTSVQVFILTLLALVTCSVNIAHANSDQIKKNSKIDFCHYDADSISYVLLSLPQNAIDNGHSRHTEDRYPFSLYEDLDGDGFGAASAALTTVCSATGYSENKFDCDDSRADVNPDAEEVAGNNLDDNCNGEVDTDAPTTTTLTALPRAIPTSGDAPLLVIFSPNAITDNAIELYQWDFDGDGTIDASDTVGRNFTFTYQTGTYSPTLTVTDANGDTATTTITISAGNQAPVVTAEASPSNGAIPLNVTFSATATDSEGVRDYGWDFDGDGVIDTVTTIGSAQFTYIQQGTYQPILTVTDIADTATVLQVPSIEVRAGPVGTPTLSVTASSTTGVVPLTMTLTASASNLGAATITQWEWDLDGDGTYDQSGATLSSVNTTYDSADRYFARVRVTTDAGLTAEDVVEVIVTPSVSLSVTQDTIDTELGDFTSVNTVLGGTTSVSVVIENVDGQVVRTLIPTTTRFAGNYSDDWDGRDDAGEFVAEGQYRAILLYDYDGNTERLDLGLTTGGRQYNPSRSRIPSSFQPYANNPLVIDYTLQRPAEVTAFMGRFNANTRLITFFQRDAMGRGTHRITWHGENSEGQLIHPPAGDRFLFGIWAYDLPDNAIYVQNRIDVNQLVAAPPIFTPTGRETLSNISFSLDKPGSVEIVINDTVSGVTHRTAVVSGLSAGANVWQWDGLDDDGNYVAAGSYRVGVTGSDDAGGRSITQYTLQRVFY